LLVPPNLKVGGTCLPRSLWLLRLWLVNLSFHSTNDTSNCMRRHINFTCTPSEGPFYRFCAAVTNTATRDSGGILRRFESPVPAPSLSKVFRRVSVVDKFILDSDAPKCPAGRANHSRRRLHSASAADVSRSSGFHRRGRRRRRLWCRKTSSSLTANICIQPCSIRASIAFSFKDIKVQFLFLKTKLKGCRK